MSGADDWFPLDAVEHERQISALLDLLAPAPKRILDLGAGTGAANPDFGDRQVVAVDQHPARLGLVRSLADRLGLRSIERRVGDLIELAPSLGSFDRVLLDAPCTGTGTLARHPDARWRLSPESIAEMAGLQRRMLDAAARAVRPGGLLVYSTCTLEPEENEERVEAIRILLDRPRDWSPVALFELKQGFLDLCGRDRIQRRCRLVQEENVGLVGQRPCDILGPV